MSDGAGSNSIIFVLDPPALVSDAVLLVCSIRAVMPEAAVIAYVPEHKMDLLPSAMVEFCTALDVDLRPIRTEGAFDPVYKQGNKLIAAAQHRASRHSVFLDTDIVLTRALDFGAITGPGVVSAVPEGVYTWGKDSAHWDKVYGVFGLTTPSERVTLVRSGRESPPYFNAGFVAFPDTPQDDGRRFGEMWLETCQTVDRQEDIPERRPWLDQICIPVAVKRMGLAYRVLPDSFNFSLSRSPIRSDAPDATAKEAKAVRRIDSADPTVIHHHQPKFFAGTRFEALPARLLRRFTVFGSVEELTGGIEDLGHALGQSRKRITELKARADASPDTRRELAAEKARRDAAKQALEDARQLGHWPKRILSEEGLRLKSA